MSWGHWFYQSFLKLFQTNNKEDGNSVYHLDKHKKGSNGNDEKHGNKAHKVHSDMYLGDDGDEFNEFGLDLDNSIVGPEVIRTNNLHYSL